MFNCGPLYKVLYDLQYPKQLVDIIVLQGGTDSGKTVASIQYETTVARCTKPPKNDPIITILNKSVPDSKKGAYRKFQDLISDNQYVLDGIKDWNKTDRIIEWKSGWLMHFEGAIDEQSAKQGKRQRLFVNEANGISYPIFFQYAKRTRQVVTIDYNPSAPFWVHDKLIDTLPEQNDFNARVKLIISDHRHNPFLTAREHEKTENIRDPELWRVYARGLTGNLVGIVYPDWISMPAKDFPWEHDKLCVGLDVGWTNDPSALILVAVIRDEVYLHELLYQPGVSPSFIRDILARYKVKTVYSELAPDMIKQLRLLGLNVIPARKGAGSVSAGIAKLKEFKVRYTDTSINLKEELRRYEWMTDPDTKRPTNEPIDAYNHLLDAARYAVYTQFYRS